MNLGWILMKKLMHMHHTLIRKKRQRIGCILSTLPPQQTPTTTTNLSAAIGAAQRLGLDGFGIASSHGTKPNPIQPPSTTSTSTHKEYEDGNNGFDDMASSKP